MELGLGIFVVIIFFSMIKSGGKNVTKNEGGGSSKISGISTPPSSDE